jgi:predicted phage tail protein
MKKIFLLYFLLLSLATYGQVIPSTTYRPGKFSASSIPNSPLQFTSHVESATEITLSWQDNSQNETGFEIYHSTTSPNAGFSLLASPTVNAETYSHTGLAEGSVHYYRIRAINANGNSPYVSTSNVTSIPEPTNLIASTVSASTISLSWDDNSTTETGFEIERSLTQGSGYELIYTTAANAESHNDNGLTENTTYYYRIRAPGVNNSSAYSVEANATTSPALNAPSALTATAVSSTQIDLAWTDNSSNETGFEVYSSTTSGSGFTLLTTTAANATTYSNTGLSASTAYYYQVRAINASGETAFTSEATATTTSGTVPLAPTTLATTSATSSAIALSWSDNSSNETGFQIERSVDGNTAFSLLTTTAASATTYTDTGLDEGRRYYYRVRATNGAGNSSYTSNVNEITTWSQAITYLGKGASTASSTATLSVPLPTSPAPSNGNLMVMVVGVKTEQTIANTPTGWYNADGTGYIDYNGGSGGDQGSIRVHVYWKIAGASETGPVDVTIVNTPIRPLEQFTYSLKTPMVSGRLTSPAVLTASQIQLRSVSPHGRSSAWSKATRCLLFHI